MRPQIAIIGNAGQEEYPGNVKIKPICYKSAYQLGKYIGKNGWTLVTGGKSGVMEEASRGCKEGGGISVGVISGSKRCQSNKFVDVEVVTNGYPTKEESTLIGMSDIIIMIGGGAGTLIELSIAYRLAKPIIILKNTGGWSDKITNYYLDERKRVKIKFANNTFDIIKQTNKIITTYEK